MSDKAASPVPCACGGTGVIINTQDGGYAEECRCRAEPSTSDKAASPVSRRGDTNWDVAFRALSRQHLHPFENGGGMIGKVVAVLSALGIDPDAPFNPTGRDNTDSPAPGGNDANPR